MKYYVYLYLKDKIPAHLYCDTIIIKYLADLALCNELLVLQESEI